MIINICTLLSTLLSLGGDGVGWNKEPSLIFSLFTWESMEYTNFYSNNLLTAKETWSFEQVQIWGVQYSPLY